MKNFIKAIICGAIIAIIGHMIVTGWNKNEQVECIKWQEQSWKFNQFYITKWQAMQCQRWNIEINAKII